VEHRPVIIQGGMGVGVSSWRLARAVSQAGSLGVVSGTALDTVLARRLQDGDPDGSVRRAMGHFPNQDVVRRVLRRYFRARGRTEGQGYLPVPKLQLRQRVEGQELAVLANFVEVWLAKEGHDGLVGINFLEKIQMATPAAALGAVLAGVDYVLMGAGVPREIPRLLTDVAAGRPGGVSVDVKGADQPCHVEVDAQALLGLAPEARRRPVFLAIISSAMMAGYLARDEATRPDGYVIEGAIAGGHNAPPRGKLVLDEERQPVYGPRDEVDVDKVRALGLPFWLAGGYGTPQGLAGARAAGAVGVQVGTLFALAADSALDPRLRAELRARLAEGSLTVRTDAQASPTGFPFKVAQLPDTLSESELYQDRTRLCDLSYLRTPYVASNGSIGYRCPSEPAHMYLRKGGSIEETIGRKCLCNALTANVGLGQTRRDGYAEQTLVTLGADLDGARAIAAVFPAGWTAREAVEWLLADVEVTPDQNAAMSRDDVLDE
jgi:NAD(P)H-dependent flavin oxidoreductase YrpB (nitropropane dioxygenase family)